MKFDLGDPVVVKHSNDDGKVVEIINDKMVMVEVKGVRFPAYTDQLDYPYFKQFTAKKLVAPPPPDKKYIDNVKKEKAPIRYQISPGVWLLFFPVFSKDVFDDDVVEELKVYLVNQSDSGLHFQFWLRYHGADQLQLKNDVPSLQDFYLLNIPFEDLNDSPSFDFEFSLLSPSKKMADYFEATYKPKGKQVFKLIEGLKQSGDAFFSQLLFDTYPAKVAVEPSYTAPSDPFSQLTKAGFKVVAGKTVQKGAPPPSVLDLHIEKLTENHHNLSAFEKLTLQLNALEKWLDAAQLHYMKELVVIHGVGSGKLKQEVHEMLKHRHQVKNFVSQFHPWYGNGATEIFLL